MWKRNCSKSEGSSSKIFLCFLLWWTAVTTMLSSISPASATIASRTAPAATSSTSRRRSKGGSSFFRTARPSSSSSTGLVSLSNPELKSLAFDEDYDFNIPPVPSKKEGDLVNNPLNVTVSINLRNIFEVNEIAQLVTMEVSLRLYWTDTRIRVKNESFIPEGSEYLTVNPRLAQHIWVPDIFIDQAKDLREPTFHVLPASLRIYKTSMLRYSARVNFDVACNMDFRSYPGDHQACEVKFESFGYTTRQLAFHWADNCNVNENISLTQFALKVSMQSSYDTSYYDISYPGLIMKLYLSRKLNYHVVQSYIPSAVFLTVSWLAFFVPPESVAERLAVAMTIMLTLTTMFASERQNVPRVSYITYLDVWMLTCIVFVFLELAAFTLVLHLIRTKREKTVPLVENAGKVVLPLFFLLFNSVYWSLMLSPPP